jgi:hypothetical protein
MHWRASILFGFRRSRFSRRTDESMLGEDVEWHETVLQGNGGQSGALLEWDARVMLAEHGTKEVAKATPVLDHLRVIQAHPEPSSDLLPAQRFDPWPSEEVVDDLG